MQLFIALALAVLIAYLAHRARSLSRSGAYAAAAVGALILGFGGWQWAILLLAFFISSSVLTRMFSAQKRGLEDKYSKAGTRDAAQVLSNGGLPALFAVLHALFPDHAWPWIGFAGALAAVNADTWATELGALSASPPRLITNLRKPVEKGTSGGISLTGTLASLAGAGLIGLLTALLSALPYPLSSLIPTISLISVAGFAGALFDSLLGSTVQAMYFCPRDQNETEKHPIHTCGAQTVRLRGWKWLDNDVVNVACASFGAGLALLTALP